MELLQNIKSRFGMGQRFQHVYVPGLVLALMLVFAVQPTAHAAPAQLVFLPATVTELSEDLAITSRKEAVSAFSIKEYSRAYKLLRPLAAANDVVAQYYLASLYDAGMGVERNAAEAAYWYRRAARNGHIDAQYNLGVAYSKGDGVQLDMGDAARWWRAAARRGSLNAQYNLGLVYMHGKGVVADTSEAVRWWKKAAKQGDPVSQYNLGALYANGDGVDQDIELARHWWQRAAAQGFEQAIEALPLLEARN